MKNINEKATISNIPRTGRIGRFINVLDKQVEEKKLLNIIEDSQNYNTYKSNKKALWWKKTVERMEKQLGKTKSVEIMTACGAKCCGNGQRKTAIKLMNEADSIEDFLNKLSTYEVKDDELEYELLDENTIVARHKRCFCGQVKDSKETHTTDTYCQCSVEFNRQFFMAALNKPVEVELSKSILIGDDLCEFIIHI